MIVRISEDDDDSMTTAMTNAMTTAMTNAMTTVTTGTYTSWSLHVRLQSDLDPISPQKVLREGDISSVCVEIL